MLGAVSLSERLRGIYELQRLVDEHPRQYHVPVMRQFCAFLRNPTENEGPGARSGVQDGPPHVVTPIRKDFQAILDMISVRRKDQLEIEGEAGFQLNVSHADLRAANLTEANLASVPWSAWREFPIRGASVSGFRGDWSGARLCGARLDFANLTGTNLSGACLCNSWLGYTDLTGARLADANLHEALLLDTVLSGAKFSSRGRRPAKGLTQSDLANCRADPDNLPDFTGVLDAETDRPLSWSGKPLD